MFFAVPPFASFLPAALEWGERKTAVARPLMTLFCFDRDTERNKDLAFLEAQVYEYVEILGVSTRVPFPVVAQCLHAWSRLCSQLPPLTIGAAAVDARECAAQTGPDWRGA